MFYKIYRLMNSSLNVPVSDLSDLNRPETIYFLISISSWLQCLYTFRSIIITFAITHGALLKVIVTGYINGARRDETSYLSSSNHRHKDTRPTTFAKRGPAFSKNLISESQMRVECDVRGREGTLI